MKSWQLSILLLVSFFLSCLGGKALYQEHAYQPQHEISRLVYLPPILLKTISLEFKGLVSDYIMLKIMTFMGDQLDRQIIPTMEDWNKLYRALTQVTNLDPRFWDPYLAAETSLPWDAGMVEQTNILLEKAALVRTDDYRPYYFLWFNTYYFEKDMARAFFYLKKAARKPGVPPYFANLAARMGLYAGDTYNGVLFLEEMLKENSDPSTRAMIEKRLDALRRIYFLEKMVIEYKKKYGSYPVNLEEFVRLKLIEKIPDDPYGGKFFIKKNGQVYTTSKLALGKKRK